jgi:hypothetical protein
VLWLGISFEQSASVGYFRRVAAALQRGGDGGQTPLAVVIGINPIATLEKKLLNMIENLA